MCQLLEVSESGYCRYLKNLDKPDKDAVLSVAIQTIIDESVFNDNYGVPRMQIALVLRGQKVGMRKLRRIMLKMGLIHERKRRPKALTKATTEIQGKENLIRQDFSADKPYTKLLTDISQIQCIDGKLYISPIIDCFNAEILSLIMRDNMKKELCIDTLKAARIRYPISGATLHSDRSSQYTSDGFRAILAANNLQQSLNGVDHCYDNARMESFFATLKKELLYRIPTYRMKMSEVKSWIFKYVFTYYNKVRIYTANPSGLPPAEYRRMLLDEALAA